MKNFNKEALMLISLSFFSLENGMAKNLSEWKNTEDKPKENCADCYSNIGTYQNVSQGANHKKESVYSYSDSTNNISSIQSKDGYKYQVSSSDIDHKKENNKRKVRSAISNSKINYSNSQEIAIQVGAFRRYDGAKLYAEKYAILSENKYNVAIIAGTKDQKPIYRVRIEGFYSKGKAEEFKIKYGLRHVFLVMK